MKRHKTRFLRHDNNKNKKNLTALDAKEDYSIINIRVNMINVKDNDKNMEIVTKCEFCESEDTSEHLLECSISRD